jgi:type II secretion system protein H
MPPTSAIGDPVRSFFPHAAARRGFTLIELMVVILIVSILTAMIIPELRGSFDEAVLRASARRLAEACDVAYSRAVATGRPQRLRLDVPNGKFRVEPRSSTQRSTPAAGDVPGAAGNLDPRIQLVLRHSDDPPVRPRDGESGDGDGIDFHSDGTADPAELELRDRAGFRLVVRVNPITSRVRVIDPARP